MSNHYHIEGTNNAGESMKTAAPNCEICGTEYTREAEEFYNFERCVSTCIYCKED